MLVALTHVDRELLKRCLHHEPGSWNDFVDRFLGLVYHVVQHSADLRSFTLKPEDTEDIAAQVLLHVVDNDYAVLRQFRGNSSLATYLTVIARRTCVNELARRAASKERAIKGSNNLPFEEPESPESAPGKGLETLEEVTRLLSKLPEKDRSVVKLYFLEGRSYEEISKELTIPMNSIGPILSRARRKMQEDEE
jgi:RNA polymerase sigma-70 factor, ECF subfamily